MKVQVKQWGNSKAIRLPKDFTNAMNLNMGDFLELEKISDNTIRVIIVPNDTEAKTKKRLTLNERLAMTSLEQLPTVEEWDNLAPIGNEM